MAYTNTWNESVPVGGGPANTADDWLRQEKLDTRERLNSIMGYPIDAALTDPVVPPHVGRIYIPVWDMKWVTAASSIAVPANDTAVGVDVTQGTHTTGYFWCGIVLPVGVTLAVSDTGHINVNQQGGTLTYEIKGHTRLNTSITNTTLLTGSGFGQTGILDLGFGPATPYTTVVDTYISLAFYVTPSAGTTCTVFGASIKYTAANINTRY